MKVLKHGNKKKLKGALVQSVCTNCECEVEVRTEEITMDQRNGDYHWVRCPECHGYIYFNL